jgi:hypothetical protein
MSEPFKLTEHLLIYLIRMFLRDNAKLNALIRKEESGDQEYSLAIRMALSNWNTTPPFINSATIEDFPSLDWLIICGAMYILQMNGVLNYRNELQYSDNGVSVNPWSKGPQYISLAGFWLNQLETQKREIKICINYAMTYGFQRSPEFRLWDFRNYYSDYLGDGMPSGMGPLPPSSPTSDEGSLPPAHTKTDPFVLTFADWVLSPLTNGYVINFQHNLNTDVDIKITNTLNEDCRPACKITFFDPNLIIVSVPMNGRFDGRMIAYKI